MKRFVTLTGGAFLLVLGALVSTAAVPAHSASSVYQDPTLYSCDTGNGPCTTYEFWYNYNTNWASSSGHGTCNDAMRLDFNQYGQQLPPAFHGTVC